MDIAILIISVVMLLGNKFSWALFGLIALTTSYFGAGNNLSTFPVTHNVSDSGLVLFFILFIYLLFRNNWKLKSNPISKYVVVFYLFLIISVFIDITINDTGFISVIKTTREWLFLACVWVFYYIPGNEIEKLIVKLFRITLIVSIIILFEYYSGIKIFGVREISEMTSAGHVYTRAPIPSTYALFFLITLMANYFIISKKIRLLYVLILIIAIISSVIRSLFFATLISIPMIFWVRGKLNIKYVLATLFIGISAYVIIQVNPVINERFISGLNELKSFETGANVQGNISFRIMHLYERFGYIVKDTQHMLFGIGNVTEDNFPRIFQFGLINSQGDVIQLDTGDVAWSLLFLRLGILGTFVYLMIFKKTLRICYRMRKYSVMSSILFVYVFINLTVLSFAGTTIANGKFWILPLLIISYLLKKQDESRAFNNHSNPILQPGAVC